MTTPAVPAGLKPIAPYLARATELAKAEPAISYWCTYYALQQAIAIGAKDGDSNSFLLTLMDKLEEMKGELGSNDAVTDDAAASAYIENFALKIFVQADREDRASKATRLTAKKFLAAANFLDLLSIFGESSSENREKVKYSKWKAADIAKAFREGRQPTPGPAGGLTEEDEVPADQVSGAEAAQLARELAAMGAPGEGSPSTGADASSGVRRRELSEPTSPSYPFPQQPSFEPDVAPSAPPADDEDEERPMTPPIPTFLDTPLNPPPSLTIDVARSLEVSTPSSVPPSHQTSVLPPPSDPTTNSAFAAAVFPSVGPLPQSTVPPPISSPPTLPLTPLAPVHPPPAPQPPSSAQFEAMPLTSPVPPNLLAPPRSGPPPPPPPPHQFAPSGPVVESLDPSVVAVVQKHAKWAISALNYDDFDTARKELRAALAMLGG